MKKVVNFWNRHKKLHSWLAADAALLGLYLAARHDRELMNAFADSVTTPLKAALGRLCALTNASVMEALYALAAVGALAYIVWSIAAIFRAKGHRKDRAYSAALGAADICLTVYVLFCLMWGVNYWTDSFQDRAGITAQPVTETELEAVTRYFAEQLTAAADSVPRDENGLYAVPKVRQGGAVLPAHEHHGLYRGIFFLHRGIQRECRQPSLPAALHHRP